VDHLKQAPWPFGDLTVAGSVSGLLDQALGSMSNDAAQYYLMSGQPTVVVTLVQIAGQDFTTKISSDAVCPYHDERPDLDTQTGTTPLDPVVVLTKPDGTTLLHKKRIWFGDESLEMSNQKKTFFNGAAASTLVQFPVAQKGWALLNCNIDIPTSATLIAGATINIDSGTQSIIFAPKKVSSATETANACLVSSGGSNVPCYEMVGGDAVIDVMTTEGDLYKTLELGTYRSFGYPMESDPPTYNCNLSTDAGPDAAPASAKK
jgi:hypothetical protein